LDIDAFAANEVVAFQSSPAN